MSYIAYARPFCDPGTTRIEVVNEAIILLASYPLFTFTEFVYDIDRRIETGWFLIGCILFAFLFNMLFLITGACKMIKLRLKRACNKRNYKTMLKK